MFVSRPTSPSKWRQTTISRRGDLAEIAALDQLSSGINSSFDAQAEDADLMNMDG